MNNNISEDESYTYADFVVAFIDILGQKDILRALIMPNNDTEHNSTILNLQNTIGTVLKTRKAFDSFYDDLPKPTGNFKEFPIDLQESISEIRKPNLIRQSFSDSFIIATPVLNSNDFSTTIFGIYSTLVSISMVMLLSLSNKHPIRGGIGFGPCLNVNNNEVYGSALERAYSLESNCADFPRILVDSRIVDFCKSTSNITPDSYYRFFTKNYSSNILLLIKKDIDGEFYLDYLNSEVCSLLEMAMTSEGAKSLYNDAFLFVCECLKKYTNDSKLYPRYIKLLNYFKDNGFADK